MNSCCKKFAPREVLDENISVRTVGEIFKHPVLKVIFRQALEGKATTKCLSTSQAFPVVPSVRRTNLMYLKDCDEVKDDNQYIINCKDNQQMQNHKFSNNPTSFLHSHFIIDIT